jgi:hypothetical protein
MQVVERVVYVSRNPQAMQEHTELSRHGHPRSSKAFDYGEELAANTRRKGATKEHLRVLGAEAPDEATWCRQLRKIGPLYWYDFDADLHARVFAEMVLSIDAHVA